MPFSPKVKSKAIEAAAAHCCVCHRFQAGHLEIHHIKSQADGGPDDLDNAIALCFDCHTWAGHYNVNHPKGFKYSPEFLKAARDTWHERVAAGPIPSALEDLAVQARYLISRDHDVSARLLSGDLSLAPIKDAVLANNEFGRSISSVLRLRPHGLRRYLGDSFASIDDYLKVHPGARIHHTDLDGYAYYDCVRGCGQTELRQRVHEDKLSQHLLAEGVDEKELCAVVGDNSLCGDGSMSESYLTRPLWVVFLALTNLTNRPLAFERVTGLRDLPEGFRAMGGPSNDFSLDMPSCEISAAQTALIPMALVVGPIEELGEDQVRLEEFGDVGDSVETMNLTRFQAEHLTRLRLYGPALWPRQVAVRRSGAPFVQTLHPLTLESVYTLDRVWQCGSCPHLFAQDVNGKWHYVSELIPQGLKMEISHSVSLPRDVGELVIAELEDEESFLSEISIDSSVVAQQVKMRKGDMLRFSVCEANTLTVKGAYFPLQMGGDLTHGSEMRNRLICQFLSSMSSQTSTNHAGPVSLVGCE